VRAAAALLGLALLAAGGAPARAAPRASAPATAPVATTTAAPAPPPDGYPVPRKDVQPILDSVFGRKLAFCHDSQYPLTDEELRWCELLPKGSKKMDARCPKLAEACARGATASMVGRRRQFTLSFPEVPGFVRYALWGFLIAGVIVLLRVLAKQAVGQTPPETEREREVVPLVEDRAAAAARIVETDVARLLDRARAAAATGNFRGAVEDTYAALLRKLEGAGVVRVEPHRTNGDHVRELGRKLPTLRPRMQAVVAEVERVQFGGEEPGEASFRTVHDGVLGLLGERLAALLPFVLALGLAAGLAGCRMNRDRWEESPSGRAAVLATLEQYGFEARERLAPLAKINEGAGPSGQVVLLPGASAGDDDWKAMRTWVAAGGTLLVAGGEHELPDWVGAKLVASDAKAASALALENPLAARVGKAMVVVPAGRAVRIAAVPKAEKADAKAKAKRDDDEDDDDDDDDGETASAAVTLMGRGKEVYAFQRAVGDGTVAVLADDRLFTNASLLVGDNARLMAELLRPGGKKVELAGELTGLVSANPFTSVQRGRLAPALLQLALVVLLFFVYKGARFGRPVDPLLASRRAFAEHARALGLRYARGHASRYALELYGGYAIERMRERLRLRGGRGLHAVAEAVAARTGKPLGEVMRVLVEARPAEGGAAPGPGTTEDLATLREIATLLAGTGGAGERTRVKGKA
jgi:hypothetical protein